MSDPSRTPPTDPGLIVHSAEPFNAEPPLTLLRGSFITPQSAFYVRSHGAVPLLHEATHRLSVEGRVATPLLLSVDDLRTRFPAATVEATLQCAGNRRADLHRLRPVSGDPWEPGAIGNAAWTGVRLADVLRAAGAATGPDLHVAFACADRCRAGGREVPFGVSIPLSKALGSEVLLAHSMNGEKLEPEHGAPLRVIVPGYAGVRSPKWVETVTVQDQPSDNPVQAGDYKLFPPDVTSETADPAHGITINGMPLNSAICDPAPHAILPPGAATLRGYAVVGDRSIARVEVSADGGRSWIGAELEDGGGAPWCWTLWRATLRLPAGEHELAVRAWDSAGQTQPARPDDVWNYKGYLSAAWHRVPVAVR